MEKCSDRAEIFCVSIKQVHANLLENSRFRDMMVFMQGGIHYGYHL